MNPTPQPRAPLFSSVKALPSRAAAPDEEITLIREALANLVLAARRIEQDWERNLGVAANALREAADVADGVLGEFPI